MLSFPKRKYDIIYADPPWFYENHRLKGSRPENHYPCMKTEELAKLDIMSIAKPNCLLFMWATGPKLKDALWLGEQWGFKYRTMAFIWHKQRTTPSKYRKGSCEEVLLFKIGNIPQQDKIELFARPSGIFAKEEFKGWDYWGNEK